MIAPPAMVCPLRQAATGSLQVIMEYHASWQREEEEGRGGGRDQLA